jgi:hypothetical protein
VPSFTGQGSSKSDAQVVVRGLGDGEEEAEEELDAKEVLMGSKQQFTLRDVNLEVSDEVQL